MAKRATAATVEEPIVAAKEGWDRDLPHVQKAIKFANGGGKKGRTPQELVQWDAAHGRRLFDWDDASAGAAHRLHQARMFMNSMRGVIDGMRVRLMVNVRKDKDAGIVRSAYREVEVVSRTPAMREQVILYITKRMETMASELRMWELSELEREALFAKLRAKL